MPAFSSMPQKVQDRPQYVQRCWDILSSQLGQLLPAVGLCHRPGRTTRPPLSGRNFRENDRRCAVMLTCVVVQRPDLFPYPPAGYGVPGNALPPSHAVMGLLSAAARRLMFAVRLYSIMWNCILKES